MMEPEKQFHFRNGTSAGSLDELKRRLEIISYGEFYHHVDHSKNDFANWVRYVLKDTMLADQLQKVTSIVETVEILEDYLHPNAGSTKNKSDMQSKIEQSLDIKLPEPPSFAPNEELPERLVSKDLSKDDEGAFSQYDALSDEELTSAYHSQHAQDSQKEDAIEDARSFVQKESDVTSQEPQFSKHYKRSEEEIEELDTFHDQLNRVIVKDFIWGMLFGLVVGFILGKMLLL